MPKDTSKFIIKAKDLATALEITLEKLYEVVDKFDEDPNDEWELKENEHFTWLSANAGTRLFSELGAFAIAEYLDKTQPQSAWDRVKEFITHHKEKMRRALVRQKIQNSCDGLVQYNGFWFLPRKDVVSMLQTNFPRLSKAHETLKNSPTSIQIGQEFTDIDGVRYYSISAIERLARVLNAELKPNDRKLWCKTISEECVKTIGHVINDLKQLEDQTQKLINQAKNLAKKRDKKTCQITGKNSTPASPINITIHHIYSINSHPYLAASPDNLITLADDVHKEFHNWMGGTDKPCTIDDLIKFVNEMYPEEVMASIRLNRIKKRLNLPAPKFLPPVNT